MNSTATATLIPTGTWTVDPAHSTVGFSVKHLGIATVRGRFEEFEGTLEIGEDLTAARAYGTAQVSSINTDEPARDEHLRSADFFGAESNPELRFESTAIRPARRGHLRDRGRPHDERRDQPSDAHGRRSRARRPIRGATSASASR